MIDNGFKFNWREPAPNSPEMQRALSAGRQQAEMGGYRPLPNMQGYTPNMQMSTDVTPGVVSKNTPPRELNQQGGFRSPTGLGMVNTGTGMDYTNREARKEELMAKFKENEDKIEQLKMEYQQLQQEESTASENLERDIAANRAGIGDSNQYNVWRSRVESRQAQDKARQADNESSVRTAKSKLNNALRDLSYARGDKETAVAKQMYEDALAEYNEKARKAGMPEEKPSNVANQKTVTMFDTKDFIRQHRDSNGHWDSEENQAKAYEMAKALGDDGVPLLDEIYKQVTKEKAINDATKQWNAIVSAAKAKASSPEGLDKGSITLEVNNKSIPATVENDGDYKKIVVNGKVAYRWRIK